MEKWTGIVSGTNRGLLFLELDITQDAKVSGNLSLYDAENVSLTGKVKGEQVGNCLKADVFDFTPKQTGIPTKGTVNLVISDDKKEMKGQWSTDVGTKGECVLYKFSMAEKQPIYSEPNLTLETKDISIHFCTFGKKSIEDIFRIMTSITKSIRAGKERDSFPPIYSITYDKEERIRTYSLDDFFKKFNESDKVWYVGFEFKDKSDLKNIFINISYQPNVIGNIRSNVLVESIDKDIVTMIPEMVRGLVSKARNRHSWCHHWLFEAGIQLSAVITMLAFAFFISKKLAVRFQAENIQSYIFVVSLILLSNIWTYLSRLVFNGFHRIYPVVEIINRPKNKIAASVFVGVVSSIIAAAVVYCVSLFSRFIF
jgi:hypothetical protein